MATPVFDEYLGPLQERDEKRRKNLVRKLITSITLLWLGFGACVAGGIALVVCFPREDLSKNGGRIAGIVCLILSIPFLILGSIMTSVFILVREAIDETREPKLFRTEELRDLMYPRQQSPAALERLNFPSYMEPSETADKLSEDCEEPPPDYVPLVDLPAYPGSPVNRNPPKYEQQPVIEIRHVANPTPRPAIRIERPTGPNSEINIQQDPRPVIRIQRDPT